jgi:acetolactate synthase-1/3 small subunit
MENAMTSKPLDVSSQPQGAVLRLLVRNHPGVMSHVCGLFARRAFNVEGILCLPLAEGARSVVLLLLAAGDARLEQLERQLRKLEDVLDVRPAPDGHTAFAAVAGYLL